MNTIKVTCVAAALASVASSAPMKDRISSEELTVRRNASASPLVTLEKVGESDGRVVRPGNESIIAQSVILTDGTHWTLIPRGSVLHVPAAQAVRVDARPVGKLLNWRDFLSLNYAWISNEEVSLEQAEGIAPLNEQRSAFWAKQDKIIVAVHLGGPISVIVPEPETPDR